MYAYHGRTIQVDLSSKTLSNRVFDEAWARRFLGGRGFAARMLLDETVKGVDPFGPENKLLFMTGPLAGTPIGGSSRFMASGKSPLTGIFGESYCGGNFAPALKKAGYDGIVVEGSADTPVALIIDDGRVHIEDAKNLWGKDVLETIDFFQQRYPKSAVAAIGKAGENGVRFANIMTENGTAGRTGLGAVMGSKRLKAIVVRGKRKIAVQNPEKLNRLVKENNRIITKGWGTVLKEIGTGAAMELYSEMGVLPTKNFHLGLFDKVERISAKRMIDTLVVKRKACPYCPIGCRREVQVKDGPFGSVSPRYGGPEYETLAAFGSLCLNDDLDAIASANQLCNAYGMDTISMGVCIAFTMECFEKGGVTEKDVGFPVRWGDPHALIRLVQMTARREGFGDLLADGVRQAAERIGRGSERYAVHVKGLEIPMHEPRGKKGLGISYAAAPRGGNHLEGFHDTFFANKDSCPELGITEALDPFTLAGKPEWVKRAEDFSSFQNSLILCSFTVRTYGPQRNIGLILEMLNAATGWDVSLEEALSMGERNLNLARSFSVREGIARHDDRLPDVFSLPIPEGACKGQSIAAGEMDKALNEYYRCRGWSSAGVPSVS